MNEQPTVKLDDLEEAMEFVSSGQDFGNAAWVRRDTGEVLWHADDGNDWEPLPEDIDEEDRYVAVPDKRDFGLGKPLALEFARTHLPDCYEQVCGMFSHRGAYARFKDLLERHQRLDAWHRWETEQTRQALREWCADNGIKLAE
jgi:hypothetical protein